MYHPAQLPDLVKDSQLQAAFRADTTVHRFTSRDASGRRIKHQEKWKIEKHLGQGSYGQVWKESCVSDEATGDAAKVRAVKMIRKPQQKSKGFEYNRELEAIAKFSHTKYESCFVKSFGWYESRQAIFIAMEFMAYGDLQKYMPESGQLPAFDGQSTQDIISQILEGLFYMHENGFAHRDLKPANVLVKSKPPENEKWWVKIGDFGISKRAENNNGPSTVKGTLGFMAPELLRASTSSEKGQTSFSAQPTDMWALGEITFRMLCGEPSFKDVMSLLLWMQNPTPNFLNQLKPLVGNEVIDFVQCLLKVDPTERLSAKDAMQHQWISLHHTSVEASPTLPASMEEQGWPQYPQDDGTSIFNEPSAKWTMLSESTATQSEEPHERTLRHDSTFGSHVSDPSTREGERTLKPRLTGPDSASLSPTAAGSSSSTTSVHTTERPQSPASLNHAGLGVLTLTNLNSSGKEIEEVASTSSTEDENCPVTSREAPLPETIPETPSEHGSRPSIVKSGNPEDVKTTLPEIAIAENRKVSVSDFHYFQKARNGFLLRPKSIMDYVKCSKCKAINAGLPDTTIECRSCHSPVQFPQQKPNDGIGSHTEPDPYGYLSEDSDSDVSWDYLSESVETPGHRHTNTDDNEDIESNASTSSIRAQSGAKKNRRPASDASHPQRYPPMPAQGGTNINVQDRARAAGIPEGYDLHNWDMNEEPIMLLGSVFDMNSLGKWTYDWAVYNYGSNTLLCKTAGELWILLIQFMGRMEQAEGWIPAITKEYGKETPGSTTGTVRAKYESLLKTFSSSGHRLWARFNELIQDCENYMWNAAEREIASGEPVRMGDDSALEFLDTIFGRERSLERTEKLMMAMRLWILRFDANCDDAVHMVSQHVDIRDKMHDMEDYAQTHIARSLHNRNGFPEVELEDSDAPSMRRSKFEADQRQTPTPSNTSSSRNAHPDVYDSRSFQREREREGPRRSSVRPKDRDESSDHNSFHDRNGSPEIVEWESDRRPAVKHSSSSPADIHIPRIPRRSYATPFTSSRDTRREDTVPTPTFRRSAAMPAPPPFSSRRMEAAVPRPSNLRNSETSPRESETVFPAESRPAPSGTKYYYYPTPGGSVPLRPQDMGVAHGHRTILREPVRRRERSPSPLARPPMGL